MAKYQEAVEWIAANDGWGDTPAGMPWATALEFVVGQVTVCMVSDVFSKNEQDVAAAVLRARGFVEPRGRGAAQK